jgi:hypothetical protein
MATRFGSALVIALLAGVPSADAACMWLGTQVECGVGSSHVVIGTQVADDPRYERSMSPSSFQDRGHLLDGESRATTPFRLELQNIGADPTLCRRLGNETYCY